MRREDEKVYMALCHLANAFPFLGLVAATALSVFARGRSRSLSREALQAALFHALLVGVLLITVVTALFIKIIDVVLPDVLARFLFSIDQMFAFAYLFLHVVFCFWGALRAWSGEYFRYPIIANLWK